MDLVEIRLQKTVHALEAYQVPYAIVGGNAVRVWIAQVDKAAVRATNNVNVLVRPEDLPRMKEAMASHGFFHRETIGLDMFVEDENESARTSGSHSPVRAN